MDGFPIHEIVGEVIASRHPEHRQGDRVVGWASGFDGLMEQVVADGNGLAPTTPRSVPHRPSGCSRWRASCMPSSSCPTWPGAASRCIGQGSIGLLFSYVAKALGAAHVTGVDPVDRDAIGPAFGVDTVVRATSDRWVGHLDAEGQARHRDRGGRTPGRDAGPRRRGRGVRRHGVLLRRARRRLLPDQHAHDAAQQPDAEIRCDAGPRGASSPRPTTFAREHPDLLPAISPTPSPSTTCRPRSSWHAGRCPGG